MSSVTSVSLNCLAANIAQPIGVERFVRNVISGIRLGDIQTSCYARTSVSNLDQLFKLDFRINNTQVTLKRIPVGSTIFRILIEMLVLPFFTFKDDVVLSINNFGPLWGKPTQSRILVIHDVWFMSTEYDGGMVRKWLFKLLLSLQIKVSSKIITVSNFSKHEISRFFEIPLQNIHLVTNCIGKNIQTQRKSCSQNRDELLLIGSDRKNKNIIRSVAAFCKYKSSNPNTNTRLIVVGKYSESFFNELRRTYSEYLSDIELAGYVDGKKFENLYQHCTGVLFPSLYEGFGLPAVEALLFGKPVLVSQNTACAEILRGFAITIDGTNTADIVSGIEQIVKKIVDTQSPEFLAFQEKYTNCDNQSKALTSILCSTN